MSKISFLNVNSYSEVTLIGFSERTIELLNKNNISCVHDLVQATFSIFLRLKLTKNPEIKEAFEQIKNIEYETFPIEFYDRFDSKTNKPEIIKQAEAILDMDVTKYVKLSRKYKRSITFKDLIEIKHHKGCPSSDVININLLLSIISNHIKLGTDKIKRVLAGEEIKSKKELIEFIDYELSNQTLDNDELLREALNDLLIFSKQYSEITDRILKEVVRNYALIENELEEYYVAKSGDDSWLYIYLFLSGYYKMYRNKNLIIFVNSNVYDYFYSEISRLKSQLKENGNASFENIKIERRIIVAIFENENYAIEDYEIFTEINIEEFLPIILNDQYKLANINSNSFVEEVLITLTNNLQKCEITFETLKNKIADYYTQVTESIYVLTSKKEQVSNFYKEKIEKAFVEEEEVPISIFLVDENGKILENLLSNRYILLRFLSNLFEDEYLFDSKKLSIRKHNAPLQVVDEDYFGKRVNHEKILVEQLKLTEIETTPQYLSLNLFDENKSQENLREHYSNKEDRGLTRTQRLFIWSYVEERVNVRTSEMLYMIDKMYPELNINSIEELIDLLYVEFPKEFIIKPKENMIYFSSLYN